MNGAKVGLVKRIVFMSFFVLLSHWSAPANMELFATGVLDARAQEMEDKTLSPYFFVDSGDDSVDRLPLKSTSADVKIAGVIADVTVSQVYKNEGKKALEAIYVFPASTRAAVYEVKMTIGERTIAAQIQKREEARQTYEKAKREGRSASLLEQQRPNVFQMNVANILPGDEIKTELRYTELLTPTDGMYDFVYPTVVGPRYSNAQAHQAPPSERWSQNPYLHEGEAPPYSFDIKAHLSAGLPIKEMSCPSHKTTISYEGKDRASVILDPSEQAGGNRDFILKYRLSGNEIESGLLLYEGKDENFFLLMMQPPKRFSQADITPREYIFIVDISGSMHGYPLETTKKLLKDLIGGLGPKDAFNVLLFAGSSQVLSEKSLPADAENIRRALDLIERQQGGGGTELLPAMKRALALPRSEGRSRTLIIATDGYVTVEPEVFDLIGNKIGDANFFAFGIGSSVNRFLIEGIARVGRGEPFIVTKPEEAPALAEKLRKYVQSPLLTRARLDFGSFDAYDVSPSGIPDLFAERPAIIFGKWKGNPAGNIKINGLSGGKKYEKNVNAASSLPAPENSALRYLWARSEIAELADYNKLRASDERIAKITDLGLKYNLLTAYTSFVAVDTEARRKGEDSAVVNQPLPLPQGVSDFAVGQSMSLARQPSPAAPPLESRSDRTYETAGNGAKAPGTTKEEKAKLVEQTRISISNLTVKGNLSEATVRKVIEENLSDIEECYLKAGGKSAPRIINLQWSVDGSGRLKNLQIRQKKDIQIALLECLRKEAESWTFPAPQEGGEIVVNLELIVSR